MTLPPPHFAHRFHQAEEKNLNSEKSLRFLFLFVCCKLCQLLCQSSGCSKLLSFQNDGFHFSSCKLQCSGMLCSLPQICALIWPCLWSCLDLCSDTNCHMWHLYIERCHLWQLDDFIPVPSQGRNEICTGTKKVFDYHRGSLFIYNLSC